MTAEQIEADRVALVAGAENLPFLINDIIGVGQFLIYFAAMFIYAFKKKKYLQENFSDSGLSNIRWLVRFLIVHFVLFLIAMIIFTINPRADS